METARFETWRKRFEKRITRRSPAWSALRTCTEYAAQPLSQLPEWLVFALSEDSGWANDIHASVLRWIYNITLTTPGMSPDKVKRDAYTRKALHDLTAKAESFVKNLKDIAQEDRTGEKVWITPDHNNIMRIELSPLLLAYQDAAATSRYFLEVLDKMPFSRKPNVLDLCLGLAGMLENKFGVPESQALELSRLAMLAHGHSEDELEELRNPDKIRDGKFRKRVDASQQRMSSLFASMLRDPISKRPIELKGITFYVDSARKK